jgi:hypothetical protein
MTANEKLILDVDLLHPAFMVRPDVSKISVGKSSNDELIPTQEITLNEAGRIKSMLHMNMGWIAYGPGNTPPMVIDRITTYKQDGSNNLSSETRDLKTRDLLRQEEFHFEFDKLKTATFVTMETGLSAKMFRQSKYYYDNNGLLTKIEMEISDDSSILSNSIIEFDREHNGLIRMKNVSIANETGELESISKTTYNYDSDNRLKNSITSQQKVVITREYQYENKGYPRNLSLMTEKTLDALTRIIRNEFNGRGDRWRTTLTAGDVRRVTVYEYNYAN